MKKLMIVALLAALPVGAQAMGMGMDCMHGGMRPPHPMGLHLAIMLYAVMAALGFWVLQRAAKETENCVRRPGKTVAWFLMLFGLLGMLCALVSHVKANCACSKKCGTEMSAPADKMDHAMPAEVPAPKKK